MRRNTSIRATLLVLVVLPWLALLATAAAITARHPSVLGLVSVLLVALGLLVATRVTTGIAGRLRRIAAAAAQVREQLPRAVERVTARTDTDEVEIVALADGRSDELGCLAAVVDDLTATTLHSARAQAALRESVAKTFVNVARRNLTLLGRQLAYLEQLEQSHTDADLLEDLFTLDHLSTRMRRNTESLLVLAGVNNDRQLRRPLPLSDVIRTAACEIEHYNRLELALRVDPPVNGHLALTTAHLIAELLENATAFSDSSSRVLVSASEDGRGVVVTIADTGRGMDDDEIERARQQLSGDRVGEFVGGRRLGFAVVGRLAGRLDVDVHLESVPGAGTTVSLVLGPAHFVPGSVSAGQPELRALDVAAFTEDPAPGVPSPVEPPTEIPPADVPVAVAAELPDVLPEAAGTVTPAAGAAPSPADRGSRLLATLRRKKAVPAPDAHASVPDAAAAAVLPESPVLPDLAETAVEVPTPDSLTDGVVDGDGAEPSHAPQTPRTVAAAQDILPRQGRRPRSVRDAAPAERTSGEGFWTARHRPTATDALRVDGRPAEPFAPPAPLPPREPSPVEAPAAAPEVIVVPPPSVELPAAAAPVEAVVAPPATAPFTLSFPLAPPVEVPFATVRTDEPQHVEPQQVEPQQVEPEQVEPEQVEPEQVEPEQVEPEQVEPEQVEPEQVEPEQVEPEQVEPEQVEAQQVETPLVEPQHVEPQHVEPQHVEPQHVEPQHVALHQVEKQDGERPYAETVLAAPAVPGESFGVPVAADPFGAPATAASPFALAPPLAQAAAGEEVDPRVAIPNSVRPTAASRQRRAPADVRSMLSGLQGGSAASRSGAATGQHSTEGVSVGSANDAGH